VLKPVVARYQGKVSRIYFRADAGGRADHAQEERAIWLAGLRADLQQNSANQKPSKIRHWLDLQHSPIFSSCRKLGQSPIVPRPITPNIDPLDWWKTSLANQVGSFVMVEQTTQTMPEDVRQNK
jgi:hypothetical protein